MNVNIEEQINLEFIKQIEELPEEFKDPLENTIEYIKKRAVCNDYEAAQINALMSEQSAQKQGYKYYCRYIAGQSTPEEDNADYYKSIRKSWDKFLDKFATMSLEERAEALTVVSASTEEVEKVLNNAHPEKLDYILEKTDPHVDKIDSLSNELGSKSAGYLATHINYTKNKADEIEKSVEDYNKSILRADKEYDIKNPDYIVESYDDADDVVGIHEDTDYDPDAYNNVVGVLNEFRRIGKNPTIMNGYTVIGDGTPEDLTVGDIIQYRIDSTDKNYPIYKYFIVDEIVDNETVDEKGKSIPIETWKSRPLDLVPRDSGGNELDLSKVDDSEGMVSIKVKDSGFNYTDEVDDPSKTIPYVICFSDPSESRLSNLYSVYDTDPTGLKTRLRDVKPRPSEKMITSLRAGWHVSIGLIVAGAVLIVIGACKAVCSVGTLSPVAIPMIFSGIGLITGGISGLITSAIMYADSKDDKNEHKDQKKNIFKDISNHNMYPFGRKAFGRDGWITLKEGQYINNTDEEKSYYMSTCESGAIIIPEDTEEIIYDGRGSRYGEGIKNQKDGTFRHTPTAEEKTELEKIMSEKNIEKLKKTKPYTHWVKDNLDQHSIEVGYGFNGAMTLIGLGKDSDTPGRAGNQEDMFFKFEEFEGELDLNPWKGIAIAFENRKNVEKRTELSVRVKTDSEWKRIK